MPLVNSQADGNVPPLPGRKRYVVVSDRTSTWIFHKGVIDGLPPAQQADSSDVAAIDPSAIRAGYAAWTGLLHGGLFTLLAHYGKPINVLQVSTDGATLSTVDSTGTALRASVTAPFTLAPGECLKATGGTFIGILAKIDEATIL